MKRKGFKQDSSPGEIAFLATSIKEYEELKREYPDKKINLRPDIKQLKLPGLELNFKETVNHATRKTRHQHPSAHYGRQSPGDH
jgi:hypothetical protein